MGHESAAVLGVAQISEDGSYVYFVAKGDLAGAARSGAPNLYVSHEGGAPVFIATLAEGSLDQDDWAGGPMESTAAVSPDGTRLAFLSHRSLTGYDNVMSEGGNCGTNLFNGLGEPPACDEVFQYDAVTGQLACASCDPTGARPAGPSSCLRPNRLTSSIGRVILLKMVLCSSRVPMRWCRMRAMAGRTCMSTRMATSIAISNVAGGYASFFMDASANGDNVFFGTADQLVAAG